MSGAQLFPYSGLHVCRQLFCEWDTWSHQQEQHHAFVVILWSPLANTDRISDFLYEFRLDDAVYFSRPETDAGRVQHTVCPAEEYDLLGDRVNHDEVAVCPDI